MFQFGPREIFTKEYRHQINKSPNVTTYLNANVTEIEADENQGVKHLRVACLSGNTFSVVAKVFIFAAGGIENARLLLQSKGDQKNGVGNQHDVVGRYFMDHPLVAGGTLTPENRSIFNSMALYDIRRVNNVPVMGKYTLTPEVIRREKLLNMSAMLYPRNELPTQT